MVTIRLGLCRCNVCVSVSVRVLGEYVYACCQLHVAIYHIMEIHKFQGLSTTHKSFSTKFWVCHTHVYDWFSIP